MASESSDSSRPQVSVRRGRRWWLAVVVAVWFGAVAAVAGTLSEPTYQASSLVQIDSTEVAPNEVSDQVDDQEMSTQRLVMESEAVARLVAQDLGLDAGAKRLQEAVTVEQVNDSRVLRVTAAWDNATDAAAVANSFARVYLDYREEQRDDRLSKMGTNTSVIPAPGGKVLTTATAESASGGASPLMVVALSALLGLLVGGVLIYLRESGRLSRRSDEPRGDATA